MSTITLTKPETGLLRAAAANQGRLQLPATMKPARRERLLDRLLNDGLVTAAEAAEEPHRLTATAYTLLGLTPPNTPPETPRAAKGSDGVAAAAAMATPSKKAQVLALLAREEGATLAELIAATGWLAHTVRAALSRLRSGGQALVKIARPDAAMAYRIPATVAPSRAAPRKRRAAAAAR